MLPLLFLLMGQPVDKLDKGLLQLFLTVPAHSVHDEVVPVPAFSGRRRLVRQLHPLRGSKGTRSGHTGNLEQLPGFHITSFDPGNSFVRLGYGGYDPALLLLFDVFQEVLQLSHRLFVRGADDERGARLLAVSPPAEIAAFQLLFQPFKK